MATHRRWPIVGSALALIMLIPAVAGAGGYEWRDHARPFDFLFENHIDTHQQSKLTGTGGLTGYLYITPTGETTEDGIPIAMHGDCRVTPNACSVGWGIKGLPMVAEYCGHVSEQHPAWAIDPALTPSQRGFSHFHWQNVSTHHDGLTVGETYEGHLLKLTAVDTFVFDHHGEFVVTPGIDVETHANLFASCEEWAAMQEGNGGHDH